MNHASPPALTRLFLAGAAPVLSGFWPALAGDIATGPASSPACVFRLLGTCPVEIFQSFAWYQQIPVACIVVLIFVRAIRFLAALLKGKNP